MRRTSIWAALWVSLGLAVLPACRNMDSTEKPSDIPFYVGETDSLPDGGSIDPFSTDTEAPSDSGITIVCPDGTTLHKTVSGKGLCCPAAFPVFCDENDAGYKGGCWNAKTDCQSLSECGGEWRACQIETLPFCDDAELQCISCPDDAEVHNASSGRPFCCKTSAPVFCDETSAGYTGGCWVKEADCSTLALCDGKWQICAVGKTPVCDGTSFRCRSAR